MPAVTLDSRNRPQRAMPLVGKPESRRNKLQKLKGIDLNETNTRVLALIQAASDGRKRANTLPPLPAERESTFSRQPRTIQLLQGTPEEAAESHWQLKYKKVSVDIDQRIVTHLRKKLNKRLELKFKQQSKDSDATPEGNNAGDTNLNTKQSKVSSNDLFHKYSDTGEKISPDITPRKQSSSRGRQSNGERASPVLNGHVSTAQTNGQKPTTQGNGHKQNGIQSNHEKSRKHSREVTISESPMPVLPEIVVKENGDAQNMDNNDESEGNNKVPDNGLESDNTEKGNEQQDTKHTEDDNEDLEDDHELFDLTEVKKENGFESPEPEYIESYRNLDVSPVQTPSVLRPLTREQSRHMLGDRVKDILQGQLYRLCPPESNTIEIYICSGATDTIPERTAFAENVLPELKNWCSSHGYELVVYDLHWGMTDTVTDDHSLPEMCLSILNRCLESTPGLNTVVILGQKYGPYILPTVIPEDEFHDLYNFVKKHRDNELSIIREKLTEIEEAKAERERLRQEVEAQVAAMNDEGVKQVPANIKNLRQNAEIAKHEAQLVKSLQDEESNLPDPAVLTEWYKRDKNRVPNVFSLQNISSQFKEYRDTKKRDQAKDMFAEAADKIRNIFNEFVEIVISDPFARKKYFSSMLGLEIEHGVLETDVHDNHCLVAQRTILHMRNHLNDPAAKDYVDLSPGLETQLDPARSETIHTWKKEIIPSKVGVANILPYDVDWAQGGMSINGSNRSQHSYLDRMCKQMGVAIKFHLKATFEENKKKQDCRAVLFSEVSQHAAFCHERTRHFHGRKELLQLVKSYLRSKCRNPLVLHGPAGCGKTALLCKAGKEIHKWFKGQRTSVLFRSIGITTESANVRSLLRDLCLQLCEVFGNSYDSVPTDFKGLVNDFAQRVGQASAANPLVVVLDSLDSLSDDHDGRKLSWLPKELPKYVHVIVSTNPEEKYECLTNLRKIFPDNTDAFIEIPELPERDAITILDHWLNQHERTLTDEQFDLLLNAFKECPVPLYLKIAFHEALSWSSFTDINSLRLSESVRKLATWKFGQLEMKHGEALVRRALGYVTASRNGLTTNEMVDLLSLDEACMDEVNFVYKPPRRRLPMVLWVRLREDLSEYLKEVKATKYKTLQWAHTPFREAAEERYLLSRDKAVSYHKAMAEYFMSTWATKPKPHSGNDKGSLRFVNSQPLYFEPEDSPLDGTDRMYNLRKVNELPHHLLNSQQMEAYKTHALCNFEWVLAKLCGTSLRALVEEYQIGLQIEPGDVDLKTLSDTIQLSAKALMKDPRQLAAQMIGRLHGMIAKDIPIAPGDPPRYPFLHAFYDQAKSPSILSLIPSITCLSEPGGILFDLLSGHTDPITAMTLTTDGQKSLTCAADNTMKLWDIRSGKVMKTIEGTGTQVRSIIPAMNNAYAITVEGSTIRVWQLRYGELVLTIDHYVDPPKIGTAAEGKYLVAVFDGINILRTWNLGKSNMPRICEAKIEGKSIYKDNSILVAPSTFDMLTLHAFRGANSASVQHVRNGKLIFTLTCNEPTSSVVALGVTRDYFVLACRQKYMTLHEIHQLELFDLKKGKYLRSVRGCTHDHITEMHMNYMGSHVIVICASEKTSTSDVALWNLETEDHKHLARHAGASTMGACVDFRYCLTATKGDKSLRIWNLSPKVNQSMPRLKKSLGISEMLPMVDNQRYVVARQMNNGPISVWNVAKAKCLQSAVRIERGLSDSGDVILVRNTRVFILTDRGFSHASDSTAPVFQKILVYDLKEKKYIKKITGCYISPCPSHEYKVLDNEHLLGLSDNRTHFIIWSLLTGHAVRRIKSNKELFEPVPKQNKDKTSFLRTTSPTMTPWERRAESHSAKQRRHQLEVENDKKRRDELAKEKDNAIEQYLISKDQQIIVASYFAHHLCVFDIVKETHLRTIESPNCMLFLHVSAITDDGGFVIHPTYDEETKTSYVTIWDCGEGVVKKRLKNESNVMAVAITNDASRVVIGKASNELHIWDPMKSHALRKIKGYKGMEFNVNSMIFLIKEGKQAVVFAVDVSVWDLDRGTMLAVFSPDMRINCCSVALNGQLITFGMHDVQDLVVLRLGLKDLPPLQDTGEDIFGEMPDESSDEEEEDY